MFKHDPTELRDDTCLIDFVYFCSTRTRKKYACTLTIWLSIQPDLDVDGEAIQGLVSLKHCKSIQALKALTKCKACHMIQYSDELQL